MQLFIFLSNTNVFFNVLRLIKIVVLYSLLYSLAKFEIMDILMYDSHFVHNLCYLRRTYFVMYFEEFICQILFYNIPHFIHLKFKLFHQQQTNLCNFFSEFGANVFNHFNLVHVYDFAQNANFSAEKLPKC